MAKKAERRERRICEREVAPLFPGKGPVAILLIGEAPGPRGADQSGIPFWGDRAGRLVYRALADAGLATVPETAWSSWDGAKLSSLGLRPSLRNCALTNALSRCPTKDGVTFRAPTDRELRAPQNLARLTDEITRAASRCQGPLTIICFGSRANWLIGELSKTTKLPRFALHNLPHPSAQGLLQSAPQKGRGLKLADLQSAWLTRLAALLKHSAGSSTAGR